MSNTVSTGHTIFISPGPVTLPHTRAAASALTNYTQVNGVNVPPYPPAIEHKLHSVIDVESGSEKQVKDGHKLPQMSVGVNLDFDALGQIQDPGQVQLKAASDSTNNDLYAFRIDDPDGNSVYFAGIVTNMGEGEPEEGIKKTTAIVHLHTLPV